MMSTSVHDVRRRAARALIVAGWAIGSFVTHTHAQEPAPADDAQPIIGCGKAQAARRLMMARRQLVPDAGYAAYLETMDDTDVLHYALDIEVTDIDTANHTCTITGTNAITIKSKSASLTEFTFRLADQYTIDDPYIGVSTPVTVTTASPTTRVVTLDQTYGMDDIFTLTIPYAGVAVYVPGSIGGSIWVGSSYGYPEVYTLSEPFFAYSWWPAKDGDVLLPGDNSDKATLEFSVTVPDSLTVASNGVLQSVEALSGDRKRYNWASDYPITTYLVSFAASVYETWTVDYVHPGGTMPVVFYIYTALNTSYYRTRWEKCVDMLETFRPLFGEYPFINEKYGIYSFAFGGGMEHQTMTGQGGFSASLTAHELAHQWWGDMITCKTWNHIWLNEGFASYAEALWAENKPGSTGLPALKAEMTGMRYTGGGSVYVTDEEIADEDNSVWNIFSGATSYNKAAWVLHMLRHVLGDDNFYDALAAYRAAYEFGAATTEDFQAICEMFYSGDSLDWFFQEWIYGERVPQYTWGFDSVNVNGKDYMLVYIDQTQDPAYQRFTMPLDIVADSATYVVFNDADPEHFVVPVPSAPTTAALDPDAWVLWSGVTETAYVPGPPKIVETSPAPGETAAYESVIDTVTVWFHTNVNASRRYFTLTGANAGSKSFTIVSSADVNPVVLDLSVPLLPDIYTLTVTSAIEAVDSGMALDGEVADPTDPASLPSGDGVAGGDAVVLFTVTSSYVPGDFDGDGDVDSDDFTAFEACFTGSGGGPVDPTCLPGDFDLDDDVGCDDWDQFVSAWTEPEDPPYFEPCLCPASTAPLPEMIEDAQEQLYVSTKNRYLSFSAGDTGRDQIIRVKFLDLRVPYDKFNGRSMWVGDPWDVTEIAGSTDTTPPTFKAARLQCDKPAPRSDWSTLGVIHVFSAFIVPGGEYEIRVLDSTCSQDQIENDDVSPLLLLTTSVFGDVCASLPKNNDGQWGPPDGIAGITSDVLAVLNKSLNQPGLVKARADLGPGIIDPNTAPDLIISTTRDLLYAVQAYLAQPYPFPPPQPWPCP